MLVTNICDVSNTSGPLGVASVNVGRGDGFMQERRPCQYGTFICSEKGLPISISQSHRSQKIEKKVDATSDGDDDDMPRFATPIL